MGLTIAAAAIALVALWGYGRLQQGRLWADWETLLTDRGRNAYVQAAERLGNELRLVDLTFDVARDERRTGSREEAARILGAAYEVLADTAPGLDSLLEGMRRLSRMVPAFAPMDPVAAAAFRDARLSRSVGLAGLLHAPLVFRGEQFRLRTRVLNHELDAAMRYLFASTLRLEEDPTDAPSWAEIDGLLADYHTLSDEALASLRALIASAERTSLR